MIVRSENETHNGRDIPRLQSTESATDLIRVQDCCASYVGIGSDQGLCSVVHQTPGRQAIREGPASRRFAAVQQCVGYRGTADADYASARRVYGFTAWSHKLRA